MFKHSAVLFIGEDGLPLKFNIRDTDDKVKLRALIEHGGGICSQSESAVRLIRPGTKVLNAELGKMLVLQKYIFDCVDENYLLNVDDYVLRITEAATSDISDGSDTLFHKTPPQKDHEKPFVFNAQFDNAEKPSENNEFNFEPNLAQLNLPDQDSSHSSQSIVHCSIETPSNRPSLSTIACDKPRVPRDEPLTSTGKLGEEPMELTFLEESPILKADAAKETQVSANLFSSKETDKSSSLINVCRSTPSNKTSNNVSDNGNVSKPGQPGDKLISPSAHSTVSSSQSGMEDLDTFDKHLLEISQRERNVENEESLSQSYTVSSSADAQLTSTKDGPAENVEDAAFALADSPTMATESVTDTRKAYIKNLEAEVEKIVQKPSPKSIQDKICLVKYICVAKKLPPSTVLQSLNSL